MTGRSEYAARDPDAWLTAIPKVELHVHLEGAIPLDALWELICKHGGDFQAPDRASLDRRFRFVDFPHFIDTWVWKNRFLREYDDFTFIARRVAENLAEQNIRYAEMFYSPPDFARIGLTPQRLTEAIRKGLDAVPSIRIHLIADLVRDFGPERAFDTLRAVSEVRGMGVVGIGIGGSEHAFPPEPFAEVFEAARKLGFRTTAHAGEADGPNSIRGALFVLRADRIGHGTRAIEDPELMDRLADMQIPIELCPISNVRTSVVPSIEAHPVRQFFDHGLNISIHTDDPAMFGNSLMDEYRALIRHHGFTREEIVQLHVNAVRAAWMDGAWKAEMERAIGNFRC